MDGFNKKDFVFYQLKWMAIYIGCAFAIMILLPFPIDLAVAIPVFLVISLYRRKLLLRKLGIKQMGSNNGDNSNFKSIKNFFKSISSGQSDSEALYGNRRIKYYCMNCGNEHKEIACPKCGSKMKRVG
jgi:hypothetical protein